ncbi:hypothetical protein [Salinibacter ruber]|uniref:hypothetical protein n=1 Tax=Salinibacter ruber TaxID=146919 RepID=UPI001616E11B|nr:hypothetical protein [Salinibacter ruber]MBB4091147.1 hypothetical protein [Salinibacter ruber]
MDWLKEYLQWVEQHIRRCSRRGCDSPYDGKNEGMEPPEALLIIKERENKQELVQQSRKEAQRSEGTGWIMNRFAESRQKGVINYYECDNGDAPEARHVAKWGFALFHPFHHFRNDTG